MNNCSAAHIWTEFENLKDLNTNNYGMIILNTPINLPCNPVIIGNLWSQAQVKITVDGGTEKWLQWTTKNKEILKNLPYPDLITGDMDSLPKEVLNYFTSRNAKLKVIVTPDQNETDFFKSLRELSKHCSVQDIKIDMVFVLVDSCGRLDQILANINSLFKSHEVLPGVRIFLLGSTSMSWLLPKGKHIINIPHCLRESEEWCALLPIGSSCHVTTTGLKWNLDNTELYFSGLVSSSNTYDGSPTVYIETDNPLLWSMGIGTLLT